VISGYTRGKILRRLDAARCGFDGISGDGNRSAGAAGIGVEHVLGDVDSLCRIRVENICLAQVGAHGNVFKPRRKLAQADFDWRVAAGVNREGTTDGTESDGVGFEDEFAGGADSELELTVGT
jgi:hypothetical protein